MFSLRVDTQGDRVVIHGLKEMARKSPDAMREGLTKVVTAVNLEAYRLLSGPGYKPVRIYKKDGRRKTGYVTHQKMQDGNFGEEKVRVRRGIGLAGMNKGNGRPGDYPINVLTGWLRRSGGFVPPGRTRVSGKMSFTAGRNEAVLFNSALYSRVIHDGRHTSDKHGPRPFIEDAIRKVDGISILRAAMDKAVN